MKYVYIREIRIAKMHILGDPFGTIFDAFLSHFWVIFDPQNCQFLMGICNSKLVPKTGPKRVLFGDLKNAMQPVICVPEKGACPVRGSQKWLKNDSKNEHFLDIKNANLADVTIYARYLDQCTYSIFLNNRPIAL